MKRIYTHQHGEIVEWGDTLEIIMVDEDGDPVSLSPPEIYHLMRTLQIWLKSNNYPSSSP